MLYQIDLEFLTIVFQYTNLYRFRTQLATRSSTSHVACVNHWFSEDCHKILIFALKEYM